MNETDKRNAAEQKEIAALEQREAEAMLGSDAPRLQTLWADDMVVNSTANLIAGKQSCSRWLKMDGSSCASMSAARSASKCSSIWL